MLLTLEGYMLGDLKSKVKKVTKVSKTVAKEAVKIAKNPEVLKLTAVAVGTAVGIPPTTTMQIIQQAEQFKQQFKDVKNNPVAQQAIAEVLTEKTNKVIKPEEVKLALDTFDKARKEIVKKAIEQKSIAKIYWEKGELA